VNTSSQAQATRLKILADEQTKSLDSLGQMNGKLQSSLRQTADMVAATQEQLKILKEEQANRQAQLTKKPKLELTLGSVPLSTFFTVPITARELTDVKATYDLYLKNSGDVTATKGILRVVIYAKDANLQSNLQVQRPYEGPDAPTHTFLIPFDYIRPGSTIPMLISILYPKGQEAFVAMFTADANEISVGTFLGNVRITPPK